MVRATALVAVLALGGCASSIMGGLVGKPLQSAMAQYGPPANVFDMPDGRRAFQWQMNSSVVIPGQSQVTTNIYAPPGAFATVTSSGTYRPAQQFSQSCLYTMYAAYQNGAWVFTGYEKPRTICQ